MTGIEDLKGKTITAIEKIGGNEELVFSTAEGDRYRMWHMQDCCEHVRLEEIIGDLEDLVGTPILHAEEASNEGAEPRPECAESWTWTFYKLYTIKGSVTLRWLGESNGYYGEAVEFDRIT